MALDSFRLMILVLVTLTLFSVYIRIGSRLFAYKGLDLFLAAFLLSCGQIIMTELALGLAEVLYPSTLFTVNMIISFALWIVARRYKTSELPGQARITIADCRSILFSPPDVFSVIIAFMVLLSYSWVIAADYYLPLRGVDDLTYHLPPVFQYLHTHAIDMLPIDIRQQFAYPQNAELLFLWPVIFTRSQQMLDAANVPFVLISIGVVYGLLKALEISREDSFFAACLYALCPVVIMQSGSNYIDVIVALFLLMGLFWMTRYFGERRASFALFSGIALGIAAGMKYTAFFIALPLHGIIVWRLKSERRLGTGAVYLCLVFLCCGWWFVRNAYLLGNPFFPLNPFVSGMGAMKGSGEGGVLADIVVSLRNWPLLFPGEDIGVGSYDGGFGLVFWGFCLVSWCYIFIRNLIQLRSINFTELILLLQLPVGMVLLLLIPQNEIMYGGRMALYVVPIGLFALCRILVVIRDVRYIILIKTVCVLFSCLSVSLLFISTMPRFRFGQALTARRNGMQYSDYRYVGSTTPVYSELRYLWEPLDLLTLKEFSGVNCYLASNKELYIVAPLYGSRLQNTIVNFGSDGQLPIQAYVYQYFPERDLFGNYIRQDIVYLGKRILLSDLVTSNQYFVVTKSKYGCLVFHREFFNQPDRVKQLTNYYQKTWPEEEYAARTLKSFMSHDAPVLTSHNIAYGLRSLEQGMEGMSRIILVPDGRESSSAEKMGLESCYTINSPLSGYRSSKIATIETNHTTIRLYFNNAE